MLTKARGPLRLLFGRFGGGQGVRDAVEQIVQSLFAGF